jgi:hypothetical protein
MKNRHNLRLFCEGLAWRNGWEGVGFWIPKNSHDRINGSLLSNCVWSTDGFPERGNDLTVCGGVKSNSDPKNFPDATSDLPEHDRSRMINCLFCKSQITQSLWRKMTKSRHCQQIIPRHWIESTLWSPNTASQTTPSRHPFVLAARL